LFPPCSVRAERERIAGLWFEGEASGLAPLHYLQRQSLEVGVAIPHHLLVAAECTIRRSSRNIGLRASQASFINERSSLN
jgi:hypothetical protein